MEKVLRWMVLRCMEKLGPLQLFHKTHPNYRLASFLRIILMKQVLNLRHKKVFSTTKEDEYKHEKFELLRYCKEVKR